MQQPTHRSQNVQEHIKLMAITGITQRELSAAQLLMGGSGNILRFHFSCFVSK